MAGLADESRDKNGLIFVSFFAKMIRTKNKEMSDQVTGDDRAAKLARIEELQKSIAAKKARLEELREKIRRLRQKREKRDHDIDEAELAELERQIALL